MNTIPSSFFSYDPISKMFVGYWSQIQQGDPKRQIFNKDHGSAVSTPYLAIKSVDTGVTVKFYHHPKKSVDAFTGSMHVWFCEADESDPIVVAIGHMSALIYIDTML